MKREKRVERETTRTEAAGSDQVASADDLAGYGFGEPEEADEESETA